MKALILGGASRLTMAMALAMGGLPSFIPGVKKPREIDFTGKKPRQPTPFSSDRQNRRTASKVYNRKMPNGQVVMQTLPAWARRNAVEVDALLAGTAKTQTVDA